MPSKRSGHFERFGAFYERRWNLACTPTQRQLWTIYEKHADNKTGLARLKGSTLAELLGHSSPSHASEARRALVALGLLEIVNDGGSGQGDVVEVRVLVPERVAPPRKRRAKSAPAAPKEGSETGNLKGEHNSELRFPVSERKVPSFGAEGSQFRNPLYRNEQLSEQINEQIAYAADPAPRAAGGSADGGGSGLFGVDERTPGGTGGGLGAKPKRKPERTRTPEQHAAYAACWDWWADQAWPEAHEGVAYESTSIAADRSALWKLLGRRSVNYDPDAFKALARAYLGRPAAMTRSHALYGMVPVVLGLETDVVRQRRGASGYVTRKPTAAARGEYSTALPVGDRRLA